MFLAASLTIATSVMYAYYSPKPQTSFFTDPANALNFMGNNMIKIDIKIRLAIDADFESLYSIWLDGIENSFDASQTDQSILKQRFQRNFSRRQGIFNFWIATDDEENIIGWQSLIKFSHNPFREDIYAESSTYIAKNCRYKGVGQLLLSHVIKEAENTDLQYIFGFVAANNKAARKITFETGWTEIGEIPSSTKAGNKYTKIFMVRPV